MDSKKKYTLLNMQQRLEVLKDLREKMPCKQIGKKYGVGVRTIQRILKDATKVNEFADKSKRELKRRRIIKPHYDEVDKELWSWYEQRRTLGDRITDALILKKAIELKKNLPSCSQFKISRGWLSKFKIRHGIRLRDVYCKKVKTDQDEAFLKNLKIILRDENISLENVYNIYESGLVWKALPTKTLIGEEEKDLNEHQMKKDRIAIGLCANALGTNKIMPLVIYKHKNPIALKHEVSLPVIFKSQPNAWMDKTLFLDWFENHFKPSVKQYQEEKRILQKAILLLDNCEAYKVSQQENEDIKIIYLPPNTSILEPLDQEIVEKTKRLFRHKFLQRVLTYDGGINEFYANYTIKNCIDILSVSWSEITQEFKPDWQDMISTITGEQRTPSHVTQYLINCEEAERRNEDEEIKEETEEIQEGTQEIIYAESDNEIVNHELHMIFERLTFYSASAPIFIQCIVQGLQIYFLGKEHYIR
ncbi:jerky protein homolog-like isoform X2 [Megalopta genalis]|uniref:jerky protein homolog-like isoform X2 n=1 Tax=Megalopta genalis TaxID=115081 RepID=UPI0014436084|nr:jerky protein homolog-like isoform X2 [Megalopta genalis]